MSRVMVMLLASVVVADLVEDPSSKQLIKFKENTDGPIDVLKTSYGAPVECKKANSWLRRDLLDNDYFMETLTHFSRERIPERVVHAQGSGAKGYFEVTNDITNICKAKLFSKIGKKTRVIVRFSLVNNNIGGADTVRDIRGFAIKFYTEEGNFDMVGLNTPVFSLKDPVFFISFIRAQRRNPETNMKDTNMVWDFLTSRPESLNLFMVTFSDRGIPDGYRYMPGFGIHAFEVINERGDKHYIKFHFLPDGGIKNIFSKKAKEIAGIDPDYANRDLYNAIAKGNFPTWTLYIQIVSTEDVKNSKADLFDLTRLWPESLYPLHKVGKLVLNKNPTNYFDEVELLALNPAHVVPGINGAFEKIYQARRISYRDSQYYTLGSGHNNIPVNCPLNIPVYTYNRDGRPPLKGNGKNSPNYYPNSFDGAEPYVDCTERSITKLYQNDAPNNTDQIRNKYLNEFTEDERIRLIENIVESLSKAAVFLQKRAVRMFTRVHPDFGDRVFYGLRANGSKIRWED